MIILHLSSEPTWRGGEQQIAYLIDELEKAGVKNIVACQKGSSFEQYCQEKSIPFKSFSFRSSVNIRTALGIKAYARNESVDLIHMHSGKSHTIGVLAAFLGASSPLILSRRVDFPVNDGVFTQWKYNYPAIKCILCVSDKIREIVANSIKNPEKCVTIHSGVDLSRWSRKNRTGFLKKKYLIPDGVKLIGNVSALAPHKDYYTFVDTAEKVLSKRTDILFFIIGDGPSKSDIVHYVSQKQLSDKIIFTGFLNNIPEVLPELDIFLITSETEGLGTTVLDAFASEVPVVATRAGGIPEMVIHRETGLSAGVKNSDELATNIIELMEDPSLGPQLTTRALGKVRNFSKEATAQKTLDVYREVLAGE